MGKTNAIIIGILLAGLTIFGASFLPKETAFTALNILLLLIALFYLVFAYFDGKPKNWLIEICGVIIFALIFVGGLAFSPKFMAIGYFAHGIWDALHHPKLLQTKVWKWYPPFCLVYDWLMAVYIWVIF